MDLLGMSQLKIPYGLQLSSKMKINTQIWKTNHSMFAFKISLTHHFNLKEQNIIEEWISVWSNWEKQREIPICSATLLPVAGNSVSVHHERLLSAACSFRRQNPVSISTLHQIPAFSWVSASGVSLGWHRILLNSVPHLHKMLAICFYQMQLWFDVARKSGNKSTASCSVPCRENFEVLHWSSEDP